MASETSETSETSEQIVCVRVACREGRERIWQAIELLRQEQRQRPQAAAKTAVNPRGRTPPSQVAER
jgi:hypothetical protein